MPEVADIWFPRGFENNRRARGPGIVGRLATGVSIEAARARLDAVARRFMRDYPSDYADGNLRLDVRPLHEVLTAGARPAMWALSATVAFVLLIACVNVGNLMLARARTRAPEMAIRQALGAGRTRLVRQLFTETSVLALLGGALGLLIAYGGVALVEWLRPAHLPRQSQVTIDGTVVLFTAALSIGVSLAFSLLPALPDRAREGEALKLGRAGVQRPGVRRLQRALLVAEVALCSVPLVAGGLMLHTFVNLINAPLGFEPDGVQTAKISFSLRLFREPRQRLELIARAIDRVAQLPGVRAVSAGGPLPFDQQFLRSYGRAEEQEALTSRATVQSVFPGYLGVTGVRLKAGRDFTANDLGAARRVAIVDERIARQLWADDAVGKRLAIGQGLTSNTFEVIGVTNAVRSVRVRDSSLPHLFLPYDNYGFVMSLVIDTDVSAAAIGPAVKQAVESLGTRRPVYDILPMRSYVERSVGDTRFTTIVLVAFAASALLLAGVGIYGTLAYLTSQRRQEFAVRMALGASTPQVLRSVVGEGCVLTGIGAAVGLAGGIMASALLRDLLYEVTPFDVPTLLSVTGVVALVALAATIQPAIRASRTDPAAVLRAE
jgi:putative ABC transport system permease protein